MRVFLIGAGAIAREHAKAAARLAGGPAELHVADARPDAAGRLAADFAGATAHATVEAMLALPARPDDVAIVCTPVFAHHGNALAALASGRHVLCEKPLALTLPEADEMLAAARAAGRRLGCCSSRFLGTRLVAALRERVASGALGEVYHVAWRSRARRFRTGIEYQPQTTWFLDRAQSGGGVVIDWGPYDIALLGEVLAPTRVEVRSAWVATPQSFAANAPAKLDVEFHAGASLVFHGAAGDAVHVSYERASCTFGPAGSSFAVEGTRGAATYDWTNWGGSNRLTFAAEQADGTPTEELIEEPMGDVHERPLLAFAEVVRGRGEPAGAALVLDGRARMNFAVLRAIYAVAEDGVPRTVDLEAAKNVGGATVVDRAEGRHK